MRGASRTSAWQSFRGAVLPIAAVLALGACGDGAAPFEPDEKALKYLQLEERAKTIGGDDGGSYDVAYNYGSYTHLSGAYSTDYDVNQNQVAAYQYDVTAFDPYSRNWSNPEDTRVAAWPAAVVVGAAAAVRAGRALAQTPQVRQGVVQGARWARDVTAGIAAALLAGQWPMREVPADQIAVTEFDFMFDYAIQ